MRAPDEADDWRPQRPPAEPDWRPAAANALADVAQVLAGIALLFIVAWLILMLCGVA